jgi:hypothetical protein
LLTTFRLKNPTRENWNVMGPLSSIRASWLLCD